MKYREKKLGRPVKGAIPLRKSESIVIVTKWDGECSRCGGFLPAGTWALFSTTRRSVRHQGKCPKREGFTQ